MLHPYGWAECKNKQVLEKMSKYRATHIQFIEEDSDLILGHSL